MTENNDVYDWWLKSGDNDVYDWWLKSGDNDVYDWWLRFEDNGVLINDENSKITVLDLQNSDRWK